MVKDREVILVLTGIELFCYSIQDGAGLSSCGPDSVGSTGMVLAFPKSCWAWGSWASIYLGLWEMPSDGLGITCLVSLFSFPLFPHLLCLLNNFYHTPLVFLLSVLGLAGNPR